MKAANTSAETAETPAISAALQHELAQATPAMRQYLELKIQYPDCILFYRMGDFYELFFEDAKKAAVILDIALTKRGKHLEQDIPMCGVPVHAAEAYLERLIASGEKIAVCEQLESPEEAKKRGPKSVVRRDVVRIITPGTLTEEALLPARANNYLLSIVRAGSEWCLAWLELSTGECSVMAVEPVAIGAELARLAPSEILIPEALYDEARELPWREDWKGRFSVQHASLFDAAKAERLLKEQYHVFTLDSLQLGGKAALLAVGALIGYLRVTQKASLPFIDIPREVSEGATMLIDAATQRNLELTQTLAGERKGSLLGAIDRTETSAGARLLARSLLMPLAQAEAIRQRQQAVRFFVDDAAIREEARNLLRHTPDLERALSRLMLGRGGPRDLVGIRLGLEAAQGLAALLDSSLHGNDTNNRHCERSAAPGAKRREAQPIQPIGRDTTMPTGWIAASAPPPREDECGTVLSTLLADQIIPLSGHHALIEKLLGALVDSPPLLARDGNFVAKGHHTALDDHRLLRDDSKRLIAGLQQEYVKETGIASLKMKHNNVLGYFVEVTALHQSKMTDRFIHRQSLAGALRYTTTALGELEQKINEAAGRALKLELEIFDALVAAVRGHASAILLCARGIAMCDMMAGLAELAVEQRYACPAIDETRVFSIKGGRHPVVENALKQNSDTPFAPNDCTLAEAQPLWLLTGPNMAGKSTFLRQNALIAILAQMGAFVPAESAEIGIVDRLFSRVGAADDLARGRSTFMVEMVETATILLQATDRSLVILDEIGRGTATYDGMSIAWAVIEHLHHATRARALFATHYHELTLLSSSLPGLACHTMQVKEWKGEIIFLHKVREGCADRSYGIHVAKLAGLPETVIRRAGEVLKTLEQGQGERVAAKLADGLPLFHFAEKASEFIADEPHAAVRALTELNPDEMSPKEALEALYELKNIADKK